MDSPFHFDSMSWAASGGSRGNFLDLQNRTYNIDRNGSPESPEMVLPSNLKYIAPSEISFRDHSYLGRGSYGFVKRAIWNEKNVAVKYLPSIEDFYKEAHPLSKVKHENIISAYGYTIIDQNGILIIEYADGGNLYNFLHNTEYASTHYTLSHAISWCLQCARGMEYLHSLNILHRDLKPSNLLLANEGRTIKICDFGTARNKQTIMSINQGTPSWMAPEVFSSCKYSEKCDVFSWGIILWEVLTRQVPYKTYETCVISWAICNKKRPPMIKNCPKVLRKLILGCWNHESNERPSMTEIVQIMSSIFELCSDRANESIDLVTPREQRFHPPFIISNISGLSAINSSNHNASSTMSRRTSDDNLLSMRPDAKYQLQKQVLGHRRSNSSDASLLLNERTQEQETNQNNDAEDAKIEDILRNFNAYFFLPSEFSPTQPDITNTQSLMIFEDHRKLALKLLRKQFEVEFLSNKIKELENLKKNPHLVDSTETYIRLTNELYDLKQSRSSFAQLVIDSSNRSDSSIKLQTQQNNHRQYQQPQQQQQSQSRIDSEWFFLNNNQQENFVHQRPSCSNFGR